MGLFLKLGAGFVARFIGLLAENLAVWLFNQVNDGADDTDLLLQLRQFGRWFLRMLAGQLCSGSRHHFDAYEEDFPSGVYGAR